MEPALCQLYRHNFVPYMTAGAYLDEGGCGDRAERVGDGDVIVT